MSKINTLPLGLQEFLGNTAQGNNPSELSGVVAGGFDMFPFWAAQKNQIGFATGNVVGTVGQGLQLLVPAGEAWIISSAHITWPTLAGEHCGLSIGLIRETGAGFVANNIVQSPVAPSVQQVYCPYNSRDRQLLPSGFGIRGQIDYASDVTGRPMILSVNYYRFKV